MGVFARLIGSRPGTDPEVGDDLSEAVRRNLPARFEAVGEALASGSDSVAAADEAGRRLADDGASLSEALSDLQQTVRMVLDRQPSFVETRALSTAWSEATLAYLHQLSCEDPLTGLASRAHLRSRVTDLYRLAVGASQAVPDSHALVIVDLSSLVGVAGATEAEATAASELGFARALRTVRAGELTRTVFSGTETVARLGAQRVAVVVCRDRDLGRRVALLRNMIETAELPARVWIEGLPPTDEGAAQLFDELARN